MADGAEIKDPVKKPTDRDKCVSVAYLRLIGATQEQAAESVGVGVRSIYDWERCSWWGDVVSEASRRWLVGIEARARQKLSEDMDGNLALKILERRLPELAPATQKTDLTSGGEPIGEIRFSFVDGPGDAE